MNNEENGRRPTGVNLSELSKNGANLKTMKSFEANKYDVPLIEIMDEIYDVHMVDLPETLKKTLEKAQEVKEIMYKKYV